MLSNKTVSGKIDGQLSNIKILGFNVAEVTYLVFIGGMGFGWFSCGCNIGPILPVVSLGPAFVYFSIKSIHNIYEFCKRIQSNKNKESSEGYKLMQDKPEIEIVVRPPVHPQIENRVVMLTAYANHGGKDEKSARSTGGTSSTSGANQDLKRDRSRQIK